MLSLNGIRKNYKVGSYTVEALKGISLDFRDNEFVSVLGPSGCGKTTLLNLVGGLDRASEGDLFINGISTKEYKNRDWDAYRNHSIGFVFQTYNLILHQNVLTNVELALTISGISKSERKKRAKDVLERVGLGDQINKKPNQLSGGQMQRVAIARALINNPDILLADEPTGALDSETSVSVMEILKEIAKDRLVIMVTHNPELAEKYSTRIIKLLDGKVLSDSNPYKAEADIELRQILPAESKGRKAKPSMSFFTALSLSLNNLLTKKARTFMTAFAGSIGIIGIALILSLSSGMQAYISRVETDTLSTYPMTIEKASVSFGGIMSSFISTQSKSSDNELDKVYSNDMMSNVIKNMLAKRQSNDMHSFLQYIESSDCNIKDYVTDIKLGYETEMNIYSSDTQNGVFQVNPPTIIESFGYGHNSSEPSSSLLSGSMMSGGVEIWDEMISKDDLIRTQYELLAGKYPENFDEIVIIVDENNEVTDFVLYALGLKSSEELNELVRAVSSSKDFEIKPSSYSYEELLELSFKLILNTDYYQKNGGIWEDMRDNEAYMKNIIDSALDVKVVGILRPDLDAVTSSMAGTVGYKSGLMEYLVTKVNNSEIVKQQKANPEIDVFTGLPFETEESSGQSEMPAFDMSSLSEEQREYLTSLSDEEREALIARYTPQPTQSNSTLELNLHTLGVSELDNPSSISIYPIDFTSKEAITEIINNYNKRMRDSGNEDMVIEYTDYIGLLMSSVSTIIDAISYILIAFVAISLVVSSIMIGIITYISVLERTKEIGILRSIGASKRDISMVFNAETLIVGFTAGVIGIGVTLLLNIPVNIIIKTLANINNVSALPLAGGIILVVISMVLTLIAGLIPSRVAANKDPVIALRTE